MKFYTDFDLCTATGEEYLTFPVATIEHTGTLSLQQLQIEIDEIEVFNQAA